MTSTNNPNQKISLWEPLLMFMVAVGLVVYGVVAFNSQDLLWFLSKSVDATPDRIVVVVDGKKNGDSNGS